MEQFTPQPLSEFETISLPYTARYGPSLFMDAKLAENIPITLPPDPILWVPSERKILLDDGKYRPVRHVSILKRLSDDLWVCVMEGTSGWFGDSGNLTLKLEVLEFDDASEDPQELLLTLRLKYNIEMDKFNPTAS